MGEMPGMRWSLAVEGRAGDARAHALATLGVADPFSAEELDRAKSQALREVHPDTSKGRARGRTVQQVLDAYKFLTRYPAGVYLNSETICPTCDGSGTVIGNGFTPNQCPACHGTGKRNA